MNPINFSIIIPHYNIPDLLLRCINSIPIRPDIQVIVVDDCSPNAESYEEKYPELKRPYLEWYSTPKGGSAGRARNIGLDHAKGKWVIFIDADDLFVNNLEIILDYSINKEEDILFFNYHSVYSDNLNRKAKRESYCLFFQKYEQDHDETLFRYNFGVVWAKIFRNDFLRIYQIRCDETKYSNDVGFSIRSGFYAKKIAIINIPLIIITLRNDSIASSFFYDKKMKYEECCIRTYVAMKSQNFIDKKRVDIELNTFHAFKGILLREHPFTYFLFIIRYMIVFPYSSLRLLRYWASWKIKAIKTIGNH